MYSVETSKQTIKQPANVALLGNPNSGKSSIFNLLTRLKQKTANFPGVTVDKKQGKCRLPSGRTASVVDFPGAYSLYPTSQEELIVVKALLNPASENHPDLIVYVLDLIQYEKQFLLLCQLRDLGIPLILALNMADLAKKEAMIIDIPRLQSWLKAPVISVSAKTGEGLRELKAEMDHLLEVERTFNGQQIYAYSSTEKEVVSVVKEITGEEHPYRALLTAHHADVLGLYSGHQRQALQVALHALDFDSLKYQVRETMQRYDRFTPLIHSAIRVSRDTHKITDAIDRVVSHRIWGPLIFVLIMFVVFQAIFAWAQYPMQGIEWIFNSASGWLKQVMPGGWFADLVTSGLLPGLAGIMVFIPQIAILFFFIALMEELGYMARAVYLFDSLMRRFGLNGRSIVALISGGACAIPAIMSTRTISNWKERLITIMVTPFISCSARIPVYTALIAFAVPSVKYWGFINLQGLAFLGLYILGILAAFASALVFNKLLKVEGQSYLMLELPEYKAPNLLDIGITVWDKVRTFIIEAGKIILLISLALWFLASYGPKDDMVQAEGQAIRFAADQNLDAESTASLIASKKIEASYAGHLGKIIEPVIKPLGFDWKIGIALISSFAAREVFVGSMATIFSIGQEDAAFHIADRLARIRDPITGRPVYTAAMGFSLLIFYVFAMQCMSTLAVVKNETRSWKWPLVQFTFMTAIAYLSSLIVYQLFS